MGTGAHARGLSRELLASTVAGAIDLAATVAACRSDATPSPSPTDSRGPLAYQRTLGPAYPPVLPANAGPRIDAAWLTRDRASLFVSFIGGPIYAATDPCSEDYDGWAQIDADRLLVATTRVAHPEQQPPPVQQPGGPVFGCAAVGYPYLFQLRLAARFSGSEIRDARAGPLWVAPPDRVVDLGAVPAGYHLASVGGEPTTHELGREYRVAQSIPSDDDRYLYLAQVFDGPTSHQVDAVGTIAIHGVDVPYGKNGDVGFIASWPLGRDSITLISYDRDITIEAFAAMANGVALPIR